MVWRDRLRAVNDRLLRWWEGKGFLIPLLLFVAMIAGHYARSLWWFLVPLFVTGAWSVWVLVVMGDRYLDQRIEAVQERFARFWRDR